MAEPIALPVKRLPKQTLHHAWAPKLSRTVVLTGRDQLHLWVMLEAHPEVTRYCERPTWPGETEASRAPDFWALRDGDPVWLALQEPLQSEPDPASQRALTPVVETISGQALDQHRIWIQNWLSLLPYLGAASALNLDSLMTPVINAVGRDTCIADVERQFPNVDPLLVRTTVIASLHQGRLVSADLRHRPWDRSTRLCRLPNWKPGASR